MVANNNWSDTNVITGATVSNVGTTYTITTTTTNPHGLSPGSPIALFGFTNAGTTVNGAFTADAGTTGEHARLARHFIDGGDDLRLR